MPYSNTAAVSRPELKVFLEQAREADKGLIADKVLPVYSSDSMTGRYPRYNIQKGELLNVDMDTKRGPDGSYNRVSRVWEWDTYDCEKRGLEGTVDDDNRAEMRKFVDLEQAEAKLVRRNVALAYEVRVANKIMNTAAVTSGGSGFGSANSAVAYTEALIATIDFARDVNAGILYLQQRGVNTEELSLVMSSTVFDRLRRSTKLLQYIYGNTVGTGNQALSPDVVAKALGIKEVLIGTRSYNSGKKGQTPAYTNIWGTTYVALVNIKSGEFNEGGIGRTITWTEDSSGLYTVETYREEKLEKDVVRVKQNSTEKIIDSNEGYLITTQWA